MEPIFLDYLIPIQPNIWTNKYYMVSVEEEWIVICFFLLIINPNLGVRRVYTAYFPHFRGLQDLLV